MDVPLPQSPDTGALGASVSPQAEPERVEAPRTVIRGESYEGNPEAAFTDWLNVTFPLPEGDDPAGRIFDALFNSTQGAFGGMTDRNRGLHGYARSFAFDHGSVLFAFGGQRNTGFLSIPGDGCALITSWPTLVQLLRDDLSGRITRWDGAVDDYAGKHSVDLAVELWKMGGFSTGGNRPSIDQRGNWLEPDGKGRTFYVGRRENGKLLRVYEKGKQLGMPDHPWVRWEVELHNVDRYVPWEVVLSPGVYVAGAYPCMSWVSESASRIRTVKAQDSITYQRLMHVGSLAYGALINVMLEREGSAERVVDRLRRDGVPRRLAPTTEVLRQRGSEVDEV